MLLVNSKEYIRKKILGETPTPHGFFLMFLTYFVFVSSNESLIPTLPIFLSGLGTNERDIGVLLGVFAISSMISRFFVGKVLFRYSEKVVLRASAVVLIAVFLSFIALRSFWLIFLIRVIQGIAYAFFHTTAFTYSINISSPDRRAQSIAYFMIAPNIAAAIIAPLSVLLLNRYSSTILFLFGACFYACTLLLVWNVKQPKEPTHHSGPKDRTQFIEWRIIIPALTSFFQVFVFGAMAAFFPLYAIQCGVKNPGFFFSINAIAIIAGRIFSGRVLEAYSKEKIIPAFLSLSIVAMTILALSKTFPLFALAALLLGIGVAFFIPATMAYSLEYAGSSSGTAVGTYQALIDLGLAIGPPIMGIIIPFVGYRVMFLCLAFICFISLCYFQFYVRRKAKIAEVR
jgi:predicted MFS family arabinose efflux permease